METVKKNVDAANEISISRLINAPRELVFEVWTEPDHIKNWWGPDGFTNTIHKMEVKPGGVWEFIMHGPDGKDYKNKTIFKEVVKPERLVYEHYAPDFTTTVTFEAQGNKTLLHWKMAFESAEALEKIIKTVKADEGLKQNVIKLEEYVVNGKRPFVIERVYNAPLAIVWKAITNKEDMKKWYFKELDQFKPEVGTEFEFSAGSADRQYLHQCKVTEVIENKKISYTWRYPEHGGGNSLVTFELFPEEGNKTKLKLTHAGLETFSSASDSNFAKESFAKGWEYFIGKQLKEYVEKN